MSQKLFQDPACIVQPAANIHSVCVLAAVELEAEFVDAAELAVSVAVFVTAVKVLRRLIADASELTFSSLNFAFYSSASSCPVSLFYSWELLNFDASAQSS